MRARSLCLLVPILALALAASADIIQVDPRGGDAWPTIYQGLYFAADGDTVLVAPAVYKGFWNRDLDFEGKRVLLVSSAGPGSTVIDCEGLGRAFYFHSGEDSTSIVRGFTIRNGQANRGGAIYCVASSPTLDDLVLTENTARHWYSQHGGGGLYCAYGAAPLVRRVVFFKNEADRGGAIHCNGGSAPTITECTLADNAGLTRTGGIFCRSSSPMVRNTIIAWSDAGNAVRCLEESSPTFSHCVVYANAGGDELCGDASDNLFEDPLFCDHEGGDLFVCSESPCLPENNPYGVLIGARGASECSCPGEEDCETLTVPGEYETITAALAAAASCDTVLVAPGTYYESNLRLPFGVTLTSSGGPDETTIDAGWTGTSGVLIGYGEGERRDFPPTRLAGFTIRGCGDSGIKVQSSAPIIEDCVVLGNWGWEGGGLHCRIDGSPLVRNVSFIDNMASWPFPDESGGGGVFCGDECRPTFTDVVFLGNSAGAGGAVYCAPGSAPVLTNCTIAMSQAERGAISVRGGSASLSRTVIAFNDVGPAFDCTDGGGIPTTHSLVFSNAGGDSICGPHAGCVFENPLFCDLAGGDVRVCDESPCLPDNNPHGVLIGAGGKGFCPCPAGRLLEVPDEYATIAEAMAAAAPMDTVLVAAGTYFESEIQVPWGVTLLGSEGPEATIIDAGGGGAGLILGYHYIWGRNGGTVIDGLTITGATDSGVKILSSDPVIRNCIFEENTAYLGGGVFSWNASPRIHQSTFVSNWVDSDDHGGAIYCRGGSPVLEDVTFWGNRAYHGGAVYARDACELTATDCTLFGNSAQRGSGLFTTGGCDLAVTNCTLAGNSAQRGSGLFIEDAFAEISRSVVSFNGPTRAIVCGAGSDVTTWECIVYANGSTDSLCGMHFANLHEDPLLCDHEAGDLRPCPDSPCLPGNNPYGVHIGALPAGDCECPEEHECGALRVPQEFASIADALAAASRCDTVLVSAGTYYERGLHLPWGVSLLSAAGPESTVIDAGGEGTVILMGYYEGPGRPRWETRLAGFTLTGATGSAIWIAEGSPRITDCIVTGNSAQAGGGMQCEQGACPLVTNVVFSNNTSEGGYPSGGGGVYCRNESNPTLSYVTFRGNSAVFGGGVACLNSSPIIDHCTFSDNVGTYSDVGGGGIYSRGPLSSPTVTNTILAFTGEGGAVNCNDDGEILLRRCLFWENVGGDAPCGEVEDALFVDPLLCDREAGDFTLDAESPCLPAFNQWGELVGAHEQGCGPVAWIVLPDGTGDAPTIQAAIDSCPPGGLVVLGPGTHVGAGNVDLDFGGKPLLLRSGLGSDLTTIDCGGSARAFQFVSGEDSLSIVRGLTIENGAAESGGGLFVSAASPLIEDCAVRACSAEEGGALYFSLGASPVVRNTVVEGNRAERGGGVWVRASSPHLADVSILGNASEGDGGGVCCLRNACATIVRSTIADNTAGGSGGGVYSWISHGTVENVTFVGNRAGAHGGAFRSVDSDPVLNGVILAFSTAGEGISCEGANDPELSHCDIYGNAGGDQLCGVDVQGNISEDPLFCDLFAGDLSLCFNTPCTGPLMPDGHMGRYGVGCDACAETSVAEPGATQSAVTEAGVLVWPNPVQPRTTIAFELPRPADVVLAVYDVAGRLIGTLSEGRFEAGRIEVGWDGRDSSGKPVSSGIYFVRLTAEDAVDTAKLVLLR